MRDCFKPFSMALVLCLLMPCVAAAQGGGDIRGRRLKPNFFRQHGGSCIYDKTGNLSYAPEGSDCQKRRGAGTDGEVKRVSPKLEAELEKYRQEHDEIFEAFAALRESISDREYKQATTQLDHLKAKILSHKRREEKLYDRLVPAQPASPGPASNESASE